MCSPSTAATWCVEHPRTFYTSTQKAQENSMVASRSDLGRDEIVEALTSLVGAAQVDTDEQQLREASVDRFKKYSADHGIFDGPIPAAIVYATSTEQVEIGRASCRERAKMWADGG